MTGPREETERPIPGTGDGSASGGDRLPRDHTRTGDGENTGNSSGRPRRKGPPGAAAVVCGPGSSEQARGQVVSQGSPQSSQGVAEQVPGHAA